MYDNDENVSYLSLIDFALKLLTIPAVMPQINIKRMIQMRSKLFDEENRSAKALMFSIIVEES